MGVENIDVFFEPDPNSVFVALRGNKLLGVYYLKRKADARCAKERATAGADISTQVIPVTIDKDLA